jgi:hypothetical protein
MSTTFLGTRFGKDPLDDPIVTEWDAVVGDGRFFDPDWDADRVALLRRFHALDDVPPPPPGFFEELEKRLAGSAPKPLMTAPRPTPIRPPGGRVENAPRRDIGPRLHQWMPISAAAAMLALVALAGLLVLYRAVPSPSEAPAIPAAVAPEPKLETLARFDFAQPVWNMPVATAWTHMEFGMMRIGGESSFTTDAGWYTSVDGPLALTIVQGDLEIALSGPALLSTAEHQSPPAEILAGTTVSVHPRDTIVFSAHDPITGNNPGSESAIALYGMAGTLNNSVADSTARPTIVPVTNYDSSDTFQSLLSTGATITLQRVELQPFDSFVFDPSPNWRFVSSSYPERFEGLVMYPGAIETLSPNLPHRQIFLPMELRLLKSGAHTLVNLGDKPITLYFFVVEPFPNSATPTP